MAGPVGLAAFAGRWTLARTIEPLGTGPAARFEGAATLTPDDETLIYREEGLLTLGDAAPLRAERQQVWRDEGGPIAVHFADGRFFHHIPPKGGPVRHDCAPDTYDGVYDFSDWPGFDVTWTVTGPRKSYVSRSFYRRAAASSSALLRQ